MGTGAGNDPPGRTLVLLRHAKSAWPEGVADHDRPLAGRGRRDAPAAGRWLRAAGRVPDLVLCSTARRARQTWELAESGLMTGQAGAAPRVTFEPQVYGAAASDLLDLIHQAPADVATLLLVGHEPAMSGLALALAAAPAVGSGPQPVPPTAEPETAEPAAALVRMRTKFPTAAIAVLEFTGSWPDAARGGARLADFVSPRDIHLMGDTP
jgi:phosphohistidine phosphatase